MMRIVVLCIVSKVGWESTIVISQKWESIATGLYVLSFSSAQRRRTMIEVKQDDNLEILKTLFAESFDLIYIDPPFNTGKRQKLSQIKTIRDDSGDRTGFQGKKYKTVKIDESQSYSDTYDNYIEDFLRPRLIEAHRVLKRDGSLFFHIDPRESHYCKILLDQIFGRESFINEIIWSYDYGARSKNKWSKKHDVIFWYTKDPSDYCFNYDQIDRIPYLAPDLVGAEKAERGKTPTDVWWNTIVPTNGTERTGYPTQKPMNILMRIVSVHSDPGDKVLDFFAGSGTTGEAAEILGRDSLLIDQNPEAAETMRKRFERFNTRFT